MSFKSALLFSLFVTLYLHPTSPFPTLRMLNSNSVAKSGNVTLNKDNFGFYVNVDFDYHYSDASDSEAYDPSRSYVSLALYTSQTLLTYSCLGFYSYYCMSYSSCNLYTELLSTPVYPDFEVSTGYLANTHVYLDYNNWVLGSGSENLATIATSCSANDGLNTYGAQRYGLIGLGVNTTQLNFLADSPIFSISLAQDGTSGTLLFESNSDIVSSSSKVGQLSTTSDWQITSSIVTIAVNGGNDIVTTASAIFDLNADALGLPSASFAFLIDHLEEASTMVCSDDLYMPSCTYNGLIKDLPTITLTIQGVGFDIPPTVYGYGHYDEDTSVTQIYLNLRGLDSSNFGNSYVTPEYQNYIIFDQTFMSYYYTEFAYNNGAPTITVYNPNNPISKVIWPYIVGGVAALIVIIVVIICCVKRIKNRRRDQARRRRNQIINESQHSEEVPLAPNNIPSSAVQNYPNYAYPQMQFPNPNHHHDAQQGMNNFAPPMEQREQREQATNSGQGYVPPHPVTKLDGNTGEGQPLYNDEYLQARQAFIRGDNKK